MRSIAFALFACLGAIATGSAQSITTLFAASTNGHTTPTAARPSVSFDLNVLNPAGIQINSFNLNCPYAGLPGKIEFYFTDIGGTYVNNLTSPAAGIWRLRSTASVITAGTDNITTATLDKPIVLRPGTYGVTILYKNCTGRYFTSTTQSVFSNSDVSISAGAAQQVAWTSAINARVPSFTMFYTALSTDVVDFMADVRSGASPLNVNFTDLTYATAPATAWDWDFNGDGITDSTAQNPTNVAFPTCGDYSVRLRVTTGSGVLERTWTNLINVDPLVADFSATPDAGLPPLNGVAFADLSTGGATAWLWDFNGDGIPDSTVPNPTYNFGPGAYGVTLTVFNGCRTASVTKRITAVTNSLNTAYNASSNLTQPGGILMFDANVTATESLILSALDVSVLSPLDNPIDVEVYLTDTTWVGKEVQPDAWRKVAVGSGRSAGANIASKVILDRPILLLGGKRYGIGIRYIGVHPYYMSSTNTVPVSNADLALTFGAAVNTTSGPFTSATLNQPRSWCGGFHYVKQSQWAVGSLNWFGNGCTGSLGVPRLTPGTRQRLVLGATTNTTISNLPLNAGIMLLGFSNTTSSFGPLPLDLTVFGMPGCVSRVDPASTSFVLGANNTAVYSLGLPNNPGLAGLQLYMQALALDPVTNAFGGVMSDASVGLVGIY
jgi:PKD repeat protein